MIVIVIVMTTSDRLPRLPRKVARKTAEDRLLHGLRRLHGQLVRGVLIEGHPASCKDIGNRENVGKTWEKRGGNVGKTWENVGKRGKNVGETWEKHEENAGKTMEQMWKTH